MDQLRTALVWLKRHHFWVLTGLVVLIPLGCWWSSSKKMSATYETGQKTIAAGLTDVQSVLSTPFHPNDTINNHQIAEIKKESESVAKLWQELYDKQRVDVLKWPASLSKAFHEAVEKMQFNDEISSELRNNYQNYIEAHFKELPKQISARPLEANESSGPGGEMPGGRSYIPVGPEGGAPGMADDNDYVCEWLDQNIIRDELNFPQRPSSLRIWVTQEDLWVYHTLLDVIAKTNQAAGATRMSNAAVKTVISLEVGQRAAPYSRAPGRLAVPPAAAAAEPGPPGVAGPEGGGRGAPPGGPSGGPSRGMPPGGMESRMNMGPGSNVALSPAQEQAVLLSGRYLDAKTGQPIMLGGGGGGDAGPVPGGPPAPAPAPDPGGGAAPTLDLNQFGTSYKQLPVRMVLRMDARWLPQLITACANEPLRVEVQEVRINPPDVSGMEAGGMSGPSGFGGRGGMPGANLFPDHTGIQTFSAQPHVKNIVVQGIIYIFNKPNMNILAPPAEQQTAGM